MAGRKITPSYRFHEKFRKAIVTVYDSDGNRRSVLLPGKYESKESRAEYTRIIRQIAANDGALPKPIENAPGILISELIEQFMLKRVFPCYVDRMTKQPTGEQENFKCAMRPLNRLFGDLHVSEFGPLTRIMHQSIKLSVE